VPGVGRVIAGTSGSPGSLAALRYAAGLARAHDAMLVPVIAWEPPGGDHAERIQPSGYLRQAWQDAARERLRGALVAVWGEVPDDPRVQARVERGPAGWVLVSIAGRPGDLLVIGAGRRGALGRMFACRVSRYCQGNSRCPVVAVPPPELARELGHARLAWAFRNRRLTADAVIRDQGRAAAGGF
jgi:nucleotide-binding universal stress UspA family protein